MNMPLLLIRADASTEIGSGHLMRCLALSRAWNAEGGEALVATGSTARAFGNRLDAAGVEVAWLEATHPDSRDLTDLQRLIERRVPAWIVLDGYHFDAAYEEGLRAGGRPVVTLDDNVHRGTYRADLVLNQNLGAETLDYRARGAGGALLGTLYALLRPEFAAARLTLTRDPSRQVRHLLVTMGGSDPEGMTCAVLSDLIDLQAVEIVVVVGAANPHRPTLEALVAERDAPTRIVVDATDMAALMNWADAAVSASGSTVWELACLGVPSALVVLADNQSSIAAALGAAGAALVVDTLAPGAVRAAVDHLLVDAELRGDLSRRAMTLVDGRGAERVVTALRERLALDPNGEAKP